MKDKIVIRGLQSGDIETATDLLLRLKKLNGEFDSIFAVSEGAKKEATEKLESILKEKDKHMAFVADRAGKLTGIIVVNLIDRCYYLPEKEARIADFYVMPEFRRTGAGKMLISKTYEELKKRKIALITAEFPSQNLIALRFYKSLGYREIVGVYGKVVEEE